MLFSINNHVYSMTNNEFKKTVKLLRDKFKSRNMIFGVEKNMHFFAVNTEYDTPKELSDSIHEWKHKGFKVHYTRRK